MATGMSLHIGLNLVDPAHYHGWDGALRACEQDARDMEALARRLGYRTTMLLTKDATAKKVTTAIQKAAAALKAGDIFFITYSGHGGQVPDRNGDEAKKDTDEVGEWPDRYDETWVLYDRMLVDDELWDLWSRFAAKVRIVMLSDSCHSGTVAKPFTIGDATAPPELGRRMPLDIEEETYRDHQRTYDRIQAKVPPRTAASVAASIALISGCQDNQTSADGRVNGRFTGRLLQVWDGGGFTGSLPKLHKVIVAGMPPDQTPNYYAVGARSRTLSTKPAFAI
jgi:hypothetical protein